MISPPILPDEEERLQALRSYDLLDTLPEEEYERLVRLAAFVCDTPMAVLSLVDTDRQWLKARVGLDATETPRDIAFCAHALSCPDDLMIVPDAREDSRFADNPNVTGAPHVRFYTGVPLVTPEGHALGILSVM